MNKLDKENNWFETTFQDKLYLVHSAIFFPEKMDKNKREFLSMIIERLIDKTDGMNNDEIEKFIGYE